MGMKNLLPALIVAALLPTAPARAAWLPCGLPGQTVSSFAASGNSLLALSDSGLFAGADNGASWKRAEGDLPKSIVNSVSASGPIFFACTRGGVYQSADGGASWSATGLVKSNSIQCLRAFGAALYAAGAGPVSHVYVSGDGGATWNDRSAGIPMNIANDFGAVGSKVFAGTDGQGLFTTANGGTSWSESDQGYPDNTPSVSAFAAAGSSLWLAGDGGLYASADEGATWVRKSSGIPDAVDCYGVAASGNLLLAGVDGLRTEGGGVYASADGGGSWKAMNTGLASRRVQGLWLIGSTAYAATAGGGLWRRAVSELAALNDAAVLPASAPARFALSVSRLPGGETMVTCQLPRAAIVSLSILDARGSRLFSSAAEERKAGTHAWPLLLPPSFAGTGFLDFRAGSETVRLPVSAF
jgi:hypothetical protein